MIIFKCEDCGKLQKSSCLYDKPCKYCGGKVKVYSVDRDETDD
jgi:rRNA maturation endonuclease Nob1